jgi:hypothetical protein
MKKRNASPTPDYLELFDGGSRDILNPTQVQENIPSQEAINDALFLLFLYTNQSTSNSEDGIALLA